MQIRCMLAGLIVLAACGHGDAFPPRVPVDIGPFDPAIPRRLTFNPGIDATPSVSGGVLVFSRQSDAEPGAYGPAGREQCLVFMAAEGGTIFGPLCPDRLLVPRDTFVDTWFEPVVSPDGSRLAYVWQRGLRVSALTFRDAYVMVTPLNRPFDTTLVRYEVRHSQPASPAPKVADIATHLSWEDASHLLFLATRENIIKVKGGGPGRVTDTTFEPIALMRLDLQTGTAALVPGGDSVQTYAPAPGGGLWITKQDDSSAVLHLDPSTGTTSPVARFSAAIIDLVAVAGFPVGIVADSGAVEWIDSSGVRTRFGGFPGPVHRLAAAGGRRFVVEVEAGTQLFGSAPDLWLYAIP